MPESDIYMNGMCYFDNTLYIPVFENTKQYFAFFRGVFDNYGNMNSKTLINNDLCCEISVYNDNNDNKEIIHKFVSLLNEKCNTNTDYNDKTLIMSNKIHITIHNYNALDFLNCIYKDSDARYRNGDNYKKYIEWCTFGLNINYIPNCCIFKADKDAVIPFKKRASDVGMDLTLIKLSKKIGDKTFMYDTGIIVSPEFGFYTKIIPRSSLVKSGYVLSNSVGIIDGTYLGTLKIVLTKVDDSFPDLTLPFCCTQLIMDRHIHYNMEEVEDVKMLGMTTRGDRGFGSTSSRFDN